jgi:Cu2+-exporting ATPase
MEAHHSHTTHNHQPHANTQKHQAGAQGRPPGEEKRAQHGHEHNANHVDHTGHELMFRNRFWVCLVLTIPVLLYSPMLQEWFGFTMPDFPGSQWVTPLFSTIIFLYGGSENGSAGDDDVDLAGYRCVLYLQLGSHFYRPG